MQSNIMRIIDKAVDILGSHDRAIDWIDQRSGTLGDTPRILAKTDHGTDAVLLHLAAISRHSLT